MSRPWAAAGVDPPPKAPCDGCGAPQPCYGLGPPLRERVFNYCGTCIEAQPETQQRNAERVRAAIMDGEGRC